MRSIRDLENSRSRLKQAIAAIEIELSEVEKELSDLQKPVSLDNAFFWGEVATRIRETKSGMSSGKLYKFLTESGFQVSENGLRTLLSRNKTRGNLNTVKSTTGITLWQLSADAKVTVKTLSGEE